MVKRVLDLADLFGDVREAVNEVYARWPPGLCTSHGLSPYAPFGTFPATARKLVKCIVRLQQSAQSWKTKLYAPIKGY